jgi:AraC-like DNA-binding protein
VLAGGAHTPVRLLDLRLAAGMTTHLTQFVKDLPPGRPIRSDYRGLIRGADSLAHAAREPGWRRVPGLLAALWELLGSLRIADADAPAAADPGLVDRRLRRAEAYMLEHLAEDIGVDEIAAAAGVSRSQLSRLYRRELGVGPAERLRAYRIEAARRLLVDGTMSVKQVARAVGFRWVHHFVRTYGRVRGCVPSAERGP